MKKKALTLDQVLYTALRSDFEEDRQHIDAVLSFYDEARAKVVYSAGCHRIALSAKSTFLGQILVDHQVGAPFQQFHSFREIYYCICPLFMQTI